MKHGKQSEPQNESAEAAEIPALVAELVERLKRAGARQVLYTLGGLKVEADKNPGFDLGLDEWLIIRLPIGERMADGRIWEV